MKLHIQVLLEGGWIKKADGEKMPLWFKHTFCLSLTHRNEKNEQYIYNFFKKNPEKN